MAEREEWVLHDLKVVGPILIYSKNILCIYLNIPN